MLGQRTKTTRLLVLDDENDVAATVCRMAATGGHHAEHTNDADVFLAKIDAFAPTHVMVDLQLADRDGIEVIHQLAQIGCTAAVIVVSGLGGRILESAGRVAAEKGLRLIGMLSKPFPRAALLALLSVSAPSESPGLDPSADAAVLSVSEQRLAEALRDQAFTTHFQPKISCADGELLGFECLARWPQPGGGMVAPDTFIALAERTGLIHELTRQIYHYAFAHMPDSVRHAGAKLALNLSPLNLNDEAFPRWLLAKCREHGIAPSQVTLELTETASMNNALALLENLTQFRIRGFHLSIDDFGVGYSSLVQLARLPFSELKIDKIFIKNLALSDESQKIVTALIGLGHSLGLKVVAEGVEDLLTMDYLHDLKCDVAQGYFIARPMDHVAAAAWTGGTWKR